MRDVQLSALHYLDLPQQLRDFVELSATENEALARVNQRVAGGRSLDEVMDLVYEETLPISPCDRLGLAFIEEDGARIVSRWTRAAYEPLLLVRGYTEDLRGSSLQALIEKGTPRIIDDLEEYLAGKPDSASSRLLVREGVRSSMTCPLRVDDRVVGVFFRSSRRVRAYDTHQVRLHLAIAERLSQAVEKAWRIERLEVAQQAYSEMLAFVAHELKSPLAGIVMDGTLLRDGYAGELSQRQTELIGRIMSKAGYLGGLVREYLDLARLEGGGLQAHLTPVDFVTAVFEPALEIVGGALEEQGSRLDRIFPIEPVVLAADADLLRIVVINLLGNAVKYGNSGGRIEARLTVTGNTIRFEVWNEGPGFPAEERSRLFRRFSRLQKPELARRKGTGVGLYTSWRIVQLHGGSMFAQSEHGQWAEFGFEFPLSGQPPALERSSPPRHEERFG